MTDKKGNFYTGYTADLKKRLVEHNRGKTFTTSKSKNWICIYYEACIEESDARRRERYLKTTQGHRMLKLRLKDYLFKRRAS